MTPFLKAVGDGPRTGSGRPCQVQALPVAFILAAVELQRHWHTPARWVLLLAAALLGCAWVGALFGLCRFLGHRPPIIEGVVFLLLGGACVHTFVLGDVGGTLLTSRLAFWAPLVCVWWAASLSAHSWPPATGIALLLITLPVLQLTTGQPYLEGLILNGLLVVAVRAALRHKGDGGHPRDLLTGVANPASFEAELAHTAAIADRYSLPLALLVCTLENDTAGTDVSPAPDEETIRAFAWALADSVRRSDTVCRWEPGKFAVLLPNTGHQEAEIVAGKIELAGNALLANVGGRYRCRCGAAQHRFGDDPMLTFARADDTLAAAPAA